MFRTALRNVLAHKARLLMTVLAVMLGVAFVSGTLVFTDTLNNAFRNQTAKSYDDVAVAATSYADPDSATEEPGISEATLGRIEGLDGVASATGRVQGFAGVPDEDGKLIGVGWSNKGSNFAPGADGKDPQYAFVDGGGPTGAGQIALDKATAETGGYKVGDSVRVATNGPVKEYTLKGVFTTDDGAVTAGGSLVLFDTATAQQLFLKPGYFGRSRRRRRRCRRREDPRRGRAAAARQRRGADRPGARRPAGRADRGGPRRVQPDPAGLRRHRALRRCLPHREHLHDARRAAHQARSR